MRATFKLLNSYFWKTVYGPIMSFVIPFILLVIMGNIFRIEYVYPGILALSFLFIGLLSLPLAIMELKRSALFKYIGTSPVNPIRFTIVAIGYFIFISLCAALIIFTTTMAIFPKKVFPDSGFKHGILSGIYASVSGFFSFYLSVGVHLIFVIISGLIISTFAKTPQQALTIGIVIIIPSMFLSGMILSVDIIAQSPVLNWVSRFIPYRYSTGNIVIASTPIDQLGDMLSRMDADQKSLLFAVVDTNPESKTLGRITIKSSGGLVKTTEKYAYSMSDLIRIQREIGTLDFESIKNIGDKALYDLVIKDVMNANAMHSDNNIFKWTQEWSVQRIPDVASLRAFITSYFQSYSGGDFSRLQPIANQIVQGDFGWLDIFLKQTNTLYYKADRVLNLLLPLSLSLYGGVYVVKNFKWSAR